MQHSADSIEDIEYVWKVSNDEGFIPPVAYYISDNVAAIAMEREEYEVTIIFLEE